jgi:hypothetical protein
VVWAGLLGVTLNLLLVWAERRLLPWHRASLGYADLADATATACAR